MRYRGKHAHGEQPASHSVLMHRFFIERAATYSLLSSDISSSPGHIWASKMRMALIAALLMEMKPKTR